MSDNYQAVYDAVRSRIGHCDISSAVECALRDAFFVGSSLAAAINEYQSAGQELQRPSAIYRPKLSIDGNMWCALYGANVQDGVAGFGKSPSDAMHDFDRNFQNKID